MTKTIVISVGGSLIAPEEINIDWLIEFRNWLIESVGQKYQFLLIVGGGGLARAYQKAARDLGVADNDDLDRLGIAATCLNARLLYAGLTGRLEATWLTGKIPDTFSFKSQLAVAGGDQPGHSSDLVAVKWAQALGVDNLINLTDVDGVYDQDPRQNPKARLWPELSWSEFLALTPKQWQPGLKLPFDPVAGRRASGADMTTAIISGRRLEQVSHYLAGREFIGTLIRN